MRMGTRQEFASGGRSFYNRLYIGVRNLFIYALNIDFFLTFVSADFPVVFFFQVTVQVLLCSLINLNAEGPDDYS